MIKAHIIKTTPHNFSTILRLLAALFVVNAEVWAQDTPEEQVIPVQTEKDYSFSEAVIESVTGDVYSDPSKWQDLSCSNLFSEGRDKPWASPPNGSGRTTSRLVKCL
ncbi:MAG: hypothetical protein EXR90_06440 [Methyloglobulus sp.]|nr:hypothetical protein [Methyloglobulus sp.]